MRRLALLLLAGCILPNPAFDPYADNGGPGGDPTATAPTTSSPDTTVTTPTANGTDDTSLPDGTSTSTSNSTRDPSDGTTETSQASLTDGTTLDPSTDSTLPDTTTNPDMCQGCTECQICTPEGCVPNPGVPCQVTQDPPCELLVGSYTDIGGVAKCYPFAPTAPTCDAAGVCHRPCFQVGEPTIQCDSSCVRANNPCVMGWPIADVTVESMCHTNMPSPNCDATCVNMDSMYYHYNASCDGAGKCQPGSIDPCGNYACDDGGCLMSCDGPEDCALGKQCAGMQCM